MLVGRPSRCHFTLRFLTKTSALPVKSQIICNHWVKNYHKPYQDSSWMFPWLQNSLVLRLYQIFTISRQRGSTHAPSKRFTRVLMFKSRRRVADATQLPVRDIVLVSITPNLQLTQMILSRFGPAGLPEIDCILHYMLDSRQNIYFYLKGSKSQNPVSVGVGHEQQQRLKCTSLCIHTNCR